VQSLHGQMCRGGAAGRENWQETSVLGQHVGPSFPDRTLPFLLFKAMPVSEHATYRMVSIELRHWGQEFVTMRDRVIHLGR